MTIAISLAAFLIGLGLHYIASGKTQALGVVFVFVGLFWLVSSFSHLSLQIR
jgi:hypothetical protein